MWPILSWDQKFFVKRLGRMAQTRTVYPQSPAVMLLLRYQWRVELPAEIAGTLDADGFGAYSVQVAMLASLPWRG